MAQVSNLPAKSKANTLRAFFNQPAVKQQLQMALPKHLTIDRLLRVAMTSIQRNPKLLECTQESLLACIMTCAQLGLEPDQFLGQAYLVPFKNNAKGGITECQLIPGYRGYITLARRSGELAGAPMVQVVYENDEFALEFGLEPKLFHKPLMHGERGEAVGAYVVFPYKDGTKSFDFMPAGDIMAIARRSKTYDKKNDSWSGPWDTDRDEMMKKTVIKRHAKLAPLSVEFQKAVALEDRAYLGESQMDLLNADDDKVIEGQIENAETGQKFTEAFKDLDQPTIAKYLEVCAAHYTKTQNRTVTVEEVKTSAVEKPEDFKKAFTTWKAAQDKKAQVNGQNGKKEEPPKENMADICPEECPNMPGNQYNREHCSTTCKNYDGCPAWGKK